MLQSSGEGEASSLKMRALAGALTMGTRHEKKFCTNYLWERTRKDHPRMIMPAKAINNEDRCVDWLMYKNIKDWNKKAKEFLISIGVGTPEQGLIRKSFFCCIELTWFILFNCLFYCRRGRERDESHPRGRHRLVFNLGRDSSRVLNRRRKGWCHCGAVCQSIIPLIGGAMHREQLPHDRCLRHHSSRNAPAPTVHPQHSLTERGGLQD